MPWRPGIQVNHRSEPPRERVNRSRRQEEAGTGYCRSAQLRYSRKSVRTKFVEINRNKGDQGSHGNRKRDPTEPRKKIRAYRTLAPEKENASYEGQENRQVKDARHHRAWQRGQISAKAGGFRVEKASTAEDDHMGLEPDKL